MLPYRPSWVASLTSGLKLRPQSDMPQALLTGTVLLPSGCLWWSDSDLCLVKLKACTWTIRSSQCTLFIWIKMTLLCILSNEALMLRLLTTMLCSDLSESYHHDRKLYYSLLKFPFFLLVGMYRAPTCQRWAGCTVTPISHPHNGHMPRPSKGLHFLSSLSGKCLHKYIFKSPKKPWSPPYWA